MLIGDICRSDWHLYGQWASKLPVVKFVSAFYGGKIMKIWSKPAVREQEVGLEVTSYLPAEIDVI